MEKDGISIQEAATLTGFSESGLTHACVRGDIKAHKVDLHHWKIDVDSLNKYRAKHSPRHRSPVQEHLLDDHVDQPSDSTPAPEKKTEKAAVEEPQPEAKKDEQAADPFEEAVSKPVEGLYDIMHRVMFGEPKKTWMDKPIQLTYADLQSYGDMRYQSGFMDAMNMKGDAEDEREED